MVRSEAVEWWKFTRDSVREYIYDQLPKTWNDTFYSQLHHSPHDPNRLWCHTQRFPRSNWANVVRRNFKNPVSPADMLPFIGLFVPLRLGSICRLCPSKCSVLPSALLGFWPRTSHPAGSDALVLSGKGWVLAGATSQANDFGLMNIRTPMEEGITHGIVSLHSGAFSIFQPAQIVTTITELDWQVILLLELNRIDRSGRLIGLWRRYWKRLFQYFSRDDIK